MEKMILIGISITELRDFISECVQESIHHLRVELKEDKILLNTQDLAEYLGVSKPTIHTLKKEGKLPFYRLGGRVYFKKSEILKGF